MHIVKTIGVADNKQYKMCSLKCAVNERKISLSIIRKIAAILFRQVNEKIVAGRSAESGWGGGRAPVTPPLITPLNNC